MEVQKDAQIAELGLCLIRATNMIGDLSEQVELTEEQKNDFVKFTEVLERYDCRKKESN